VSALARQSSPSAAEHFSQTAPAPPHAGSGGDTADESGFSPYPGNVNTLVLELEPYSAALEASGGSMPEFVNPKYTDETKSRFKKPTRLECMMQDLPKLLPDDASVGFTDFDRWFVRTVLP